MATVNGYLLTSTNQEYYEHPHRPFTSATSLTLAQAIATTDIDSANDLLSFMKIPDGCRIERIDYEITDIDTGSNSDLDIVILENIDGTATTTTLLNGGGSVGQAAASDTVWPSAGSTYIHKVAETDDGYGVLQLKQIASRSATAGTFYVTVFYR